MNADSLRFCDSGVIRSANNRLFISPVWRRVLLNTDVTCGAIVWGAARVSKAKAPIIRYPAAVGCSGSQKK